MKTLGERLLRVVLPPDDRRHVLDELEELYRLHRERVGPEEAEAWRRRQLWIFVLKALPTFWWKRPLAGWLGLFSNRDGHPGSFDILRQDLRFAYRSFLRRPGFVLAAVLILGVGIGATTTIFSVVDTVMLRPLPYPDQLQLAHFGGYGGTRPRLYVRWRDGLESFETVDAAWNHSASLTGDGRPITLRTSRVTPGLLSTLGARPHLGRLFMEEDYESGTPVALLDYGFWQRQWGGDPDVVGQTIQLDGRSVVVAGVVSSAFTPPEAVTGKRVDLWQPFRAESPESFGWSILSVVGRLKPGIGYGAAQSELDAYTAHISEELPDLLIRRDGSLRTTRLIPLQVATAGDAAGPLLLLLWAVLLMLLIACANVANLLLAHGTARFREISLRGALGAGRRRILQQLLTESVALALMGGTLGVGLAFVSVELFRRFIPADVPRIEELAVDPRILLFALLASLATGLVFGMTPALHAAGRDVVGALKEGGTALAGSRRGSRIRSILVISEIALALVLLTGAGLFFRSLLIQAQVHPGFQSEALVTVPLHLGGSYDAARRQQFTVAVRERILAQPGTEGAAAGLTAPFQYLGSSMCCISNEVRAVDGLPEAEPIYHAMIHPISPGYFQTLQAQVRYGREFEAADESGDGKVVILNEPVARRLFGEADAVGRTIRIGEADLRTIVGVVEGVHHYGTAMGIGPNIYVPYSQWGSFSDIYHLMVRSTLDLETLAPRIREAIASVDPGLPVDEIVPMRRRVESALAGQRFLTILLGTFAAVALLLATGGIYASMLYSVGQRRQEMGIRLALGAKGGQVVGLILLGGLGTTLIGIGLGLAASLGLSRLLRSFLYGVSVGDSLTFTTVIAILTGAALLACLIPALRAARTNPMETLKVE
jgi:predicted permease